MKRRAPLSLLLVLSVLALAAGAVSAQQVYRQVDKNGKVVFSDQPPAANAAPAPTRGGMSTVESNGAALPYELQQVVQRYPVMLYTRDECSPCDAGRSLLTTRGIPFNERQIKSPEDGEALQRLTGQNALPLLAIGGQQLKGFSDGEWSQYLDAAGYAKSVRLPAGYRYAPAQPLVALQPAVVAPAPSAPARSATPVPPAPGPTPANPTGIRF